MTKRLAVALIALGLCLHAGSASAQAGTGVTAGVAWSKVTGEDMEEGDWLTGWSAGAFATTPLARRVFFQSEVLYTRKGLAWTDEGESVKLRLDYVEVPLLFRYSSSSPGRLGFDVFGGVAPAMRVGAKSVVEEAGDRDENDISDEVTAWDAGVVLGAGLSYDRVSAEIRWTEGLVNVAKEASDSRVRNRTVSVLASFRF